MNFFPPKSCRAFWILFLSTLYLVELKSQCDPPDQLPAVICNQAPLTCLQDACYTTSNLSMPGWNGFCGNNTAIHNPQYFEVIVTDACISINILVEDCTAGSALQAALVSNCEWQPCQGGNVPCPDVLDCDPGTGVGGTMIMNACGLTPGQSLWLLIDGSNAAHCQYTISFAEGIFEPQIDDTLTFVDINYPVACQGYDEIHLTANPTIANASGYLWEFGWDNSQEITSYPEIGISISTNAPTGTWEICVSAISGCDTTDNQVCTQLIIVEFEDVIKEPATFCPEAFPFQWHSVVVTGPGTYTQDFESNEGCTYDSIWMVEEFPEVPVGQLHIVHCFNENFDPFIYEGEAYYDPGIYEIVYPDMGLNGCDSFAELRLELKGVELFIENICVEGQTFLSPHITSIIPANDSIYYEWYDCNFTQLLSTDQFFESDTNGCFCLIAKSGICGDTICSTYIGNPCELACTLVQEQTCIGDSVLFTYQIEDSINATFHWLIDRPGRGEFYYTGNDSLWLTFDSAGCYRASVTVVDASSTLTCIDSVCLLPPSSDVSICCDTIICQECTSLTFTMTGVAPWTIILFDGNKLDTITGIETSPYEHLVCVLQTTQFTIVEAYGSGDLCLASISNDSVEIQYSNPWPCPDCPFFYQIDSTLCASTDLPGYKWYECGDTTVLSADKCFMPPVSGCYCLDAFGTEHCELTSCEDIIVRTSQPGFRSDITILPNPSNGIINIKLEDETQLPLQWKLVNQLGIKYQSGIITEVNAQLDLGNEITAGVYFMQLNAGHKQLGIFKIIIE